MPAFSTHDELKGGCNLLLFKTVLSLLSLFCLRQKSLGISRISQHKYRRRKKPCTKCRFDPVSFITIVQDDATWTTTTTTAEKNYGWLIAV